MKHQLRIAALALTAAVLLSGPAEATLITLTGTDFNLVYDDTKLGLFGAPTLVGDTIFFTPNNFKAISTNGQGTVPTDSTVNGMELIAHPGFTFGSVQLAEFGDYLMTGTGSSVSVTGQLRAFDWNNSLLTQTTSTITPSGPLNVIDGISHDWQAIATINDYSIPVSGGSGWLAGASQVGLALENLLSAYTPACPVNGCTQAEYALIEKKFGGLGITLSAPVPVPASAWLFGTALGLLGLRRRKA